MLLVSYYIYCARMNGDKNTPVPQPGHFMGWLFPLRSLPSPRAWVQSCRRGARLIQRGSVRAAANALVFLVGFDSPHFFLLMTKSYCLSGINISELLPSPNPIIYISEQENSKLLKDIILPLHSAYLQRNILLRGGKSSGCYYYFWQTPKESS